MIGIVLHILSSVSLRRIRDRVADALCICRRLRSLAVICLELLTVEPVNGFIVEASAIFNDPRRRSPLCITGDIASRVARMGSEDGEVGLPILPRTDRGGDFCEHVNNSGVSVAWKIVSVEEVICSGDMVD